MKKFFAAALLAASVLAVVNSTASAGSFTIGVGITFGWHCDKPGGLRGHYAGGHGADSLAGLPSYYSPIIGGTPPVSYAPAMHGVQGVQPMPPAFEGPQPKLAPEIKQSFYQTPAYAPATYYPYNGYGNGGSWMNQAPGYWYGY